MRSPEHPPKQLRETTTLRDIFTDLTRAKVSELTLASKTINTDVLYIYLSNGLKFAIICYFGNFTSNK
jgi:hypothetical protein